MGQVLPRDQIFKLHMVLPGGKIAETFDQDSKEGIKHRPSFS